MKSHARNALIMIAGVLALIAICSTSRPACVADPAFFLHGTAFDCRAGAR
jgi:hypothetical protein